MAGYPPPYPPNQPFPYDPRQQARFVREQMKAQARAQKMAFRAQRMAYRDQARALRRTSILGPLLIVVIGVVLLLIRLDRIPFSEFAFFYGHWWPLLLVAAGIVRLLEWAFDHYSHHEGVPFIRRGVGGGVVFLLILLAVTGASIQTFHVNQAFPAGWHIDGENFNEVFGDRHEYEQQIDRDFPAGTTLNIDNPHGDVTVVGKSGDDKIHIVVNKQVYSWNGGDASSRADQLSPRVTSSGGSLSVTIPTLESAQADLAVTLPENGQITVNANHGAINVSDMKAPVNLTANHGDIEINRIVGSVSVHVNSNSASFSAHGVQGDVTVRGHADDLNLTEISGSVSLEGEFWGDTHLEHLGGPVAFRTGRTQFSLGKLDGMVDISHDAELTGSQIVGPTELRTHSRNISLERVAGSVDIINKDGTVDLTNAAPLGNVSIDNPDGAVTVTVPEHAGLTIDAQTRDGAIQDDLDNTSVPSTARASHAATIGDGAAHFTIHSAHADITIHQGVVEPPAAPPPVIAAPPAPPVPPATAGPPAKTAPRRAPAKAIKSAVPTADA